MSAYYQQNPPKYPSERRTPRAFWPCMFGLLSVLAYLVATLGHLFTYWHP